MAGVSTLFITPRLRSSNYVSLLNEAIPSLKTNGAIISDPALPSLRRVILVDNISHSGGDFSSEKSLLPSAIDFREILVWREDDQIKREVDRIADGLTNEEVINLQFTRFVEIVPCVKYITDFTSRLQWNYRGAESRISMIRSRFSYNPLTCHGSASSSLIATC